MSTEMEVNGSPETKESESQGTKNDHEKSETDTDSESEDQIEYSNVASSTTNESYPTFDILEDNIYLGNKKKRVNKEIRRMSCDCPYSPEEHDFVGCGDDCLNRLLMIECNNRCPCGESCSNRKFQEGQKIQVEAFKTDKKGWGLRTLEDVAANQFVIEYCGEVMGYEEFENRVEMYDDEHRRHYYFMTLRADEIIDATHKGNLSRFINHSCSPNCETQKWTVNGYLRIGFFSIKDIKAGTELTFDYKFQRYGKKAQVCYCESSNCRGIIGGEKHTPLKSIISGRPASPAPTSSPRRNRRRRLAEQFDDKPLEIEIAQLLGSDKGIKSDDQALKLSQFMVRAETQSQRLLLLDTLWATEDPNCLRSILRYQGLSLLWSWMVDLGDNSLCFQKKIVQVLKHLPVANLNQVKDTKVLKVVNKWAKKPSVSCVPEEETSSSDVDSRGLSPLEIPDDTSKRDGDISSSSTDIGFDDLQNASKPKNMETQPIADDSQDTTKAKTLNENPETPIDGEGEAGVTEKAETQKPKEDKDEDSVFQEVDEAKAATVKFASGENQTVCEMAVVAPGIGESSEEESRWSEDDSTSTEGENIKDLAADLLDSWSNLKEVYRIPKKSTIVVKREPESTSGAVDAVVTESGIIRHALQIPHIPTIEGDLFQKDEFLSKLGELDRKPFQQESSELPSLMSSTLPAPDLEDTAHDTSKLPIHQRLQMVASGAKTPKQHPVWHEKGAKRARKHPYHAGGAGAFPSGPEKWAHRHQVAGKSRFIQPGGVPQNHPTHAGGQLGPSMGNAQWQAQDSSAYPGGFQYPPGGGPAGYPTPNPNQAAAQVGAMQSSYFTPSGPQHGQAADHALYQQGYPNTTEQSSFGPGPSQLPAQGGIQTNPLGYQQRQQPVNQPVYQMPLFDPSKPPPNFGPAQTNIPSQQFPNIAQFPNPSSQFSNSPPGYSTTPQVPGYPMQPPQAQHVPEQVMSQTALPSVVEHSQAMGHQYPSNAVSTTSMVSSTVNETETSKTDVGSRSEGWPVESFNRPQEVPLPSDWKKAYDGEGRAYYYHVVTRQTQWEPPATDRSPPTPELGYLGDELDSSMEMTTTFPSHITTDVVMEVVDPNKRKKPKTPSTPPGSPPKSPMGKYTTAAADTTDVRKGLYSPSLLLQGRHLTPEQRKLRETFRMKLSAVVVNYLNPYHKLDCKVGRIATVDDFKFLARKLTHGVMVKELARLKDESQLACNDSVKIKTKEYIRYYMQKFGPVYKAS